MSFIPWLISCAVWVSYLQRSQRVRVTFEHLVLVNDSVDAQLQLNTNGGSAPVEPKIAAGLGPTQYRNGWMDDGSRIRPTRNAIDSQPTASTASAINERAVAALYAAGSQVNKENAVHQARNETTPADALTRLDAAEEGYWAAAMAEVESDSRRLGVWAKAFAEADGNETKAKAAYLRVRVRQLINAVEVRH